MQEYENNNDIGKWGAYWRLVGVDYSGWAILLG